MRALGSDELSERVLGSLGLSTSSTTGLTSPEALAALLRRVASFACPCPAPQLVQTVLGSLRGLVGDAEALRPSMEDVLDALVSYGDLGEFGDLSDIEQGIGRGWLGLMPPSFVRRSSGAVLLLGIIPDRISPLPDELACRVSYVEHVRRIEPRPGEDLALQLRSLGLFELTERLWLRSPKVEAAAQHRSRLDAELTKTPGASVATGLVLLEGDRNPRYYRGRWVEARLQSGCFVARRPQTYGAALWCYVELSAGRLVHLLDLPLRGSLYRGCDEAWRLQAALDALQGTPQRYRCRDLSDGRVALDLFSPVPLWIRRGWEAVGTATPPHHCLFTYAFDRGEVDEVTRALQQALWLRPLEAEG